MSLNNIKNMKKNDGFTIVELLIVIVVIGILAAITIVAYNGVQTRANNSAAQAAGETVAKKAEAYNAVNSSYPGTIAAFATVPESRLDGVTLGTPTAATGKNTVQFLTCATPAGYRVVTWDYSTGAVQTATTASHGGGATSASTCTAVI
jgi:prepilin-type N-terminal cleavage/methylation domain-containing protein